LSFVSYLLTNGWKNKEISIGSPQDVHRKRVDLQITQEYSATVQIRTETLLWMFPQQLGIGLM